MAHTPGPWRVEGGLTLVGDPYSIDGQHMLYSASIRMDSFVGSVCSILSADHCATGISREKAEANALLIAAAPDLLDALKAVLSNCLDSQGLADAYEQARAAIAKATGEQ